MMTDIVGWSSSIILLLTIGRQVWRQWRTGVGEGVSKWLYIGQIAASAGFTVYSVLVGNWVFIVTNSLLLLSALAGLYIHLYHCRRQGAAGKTGNTAAERAGNAAPGPARNAAAAPG